MANTNRTTTARTPVSNKRLVAERDLLRLENAFLERVARALSSRP
jgi:hypothetical protein